MAVFAIGSGLLIWVGRVQTESQAWGLGPILGGGDGCDLWRGAGLFIDVAHHRRIGDGSYESLRLSAARSSGRQAGCRGGREEAFVVGDERGQLGTEHRVPGREMDRV